MEEENIYRFLTDKMDQEERNAFLLEIESNRELKQSVEHSRRIRNVVAKDTIKFGQDVRAVIDLNKGNPYKSLWITATMGLVFISAIYYLFFIQTSTDNLVEKYLEPFPDIVASRSDAGLVLDLSAYNQGNYPDASSALQKQYDFHKEPLTALYLGVSYLLSNQEEKALTIFEETDLENTLLKEDFFWYKSLSLIKLNKEVEAKILLRTLKNSQTTYSSKSSRLLEDLD